MEHLSLVLDMVRRPYRIDRHPADRVDHSWWPVLAWRLLRGGCVVCGHRDGSVSLRTRELYPYRAYCKYLSGVYKRYYGDFGCNATASLT